MSLAGAITMELNRTKEKRICVVGPPPSERGGVSRSTLMIIYIFRKILGYNTIFLPICLLDIVRDNRVLKLFRSCNVIHLQYPTILLLLLLFTTARRPKIILTLRGWVIKEMLIYFRSDKKTFRRFFKLVYFMVLWNLYRYLLSRSVIDYITSVSRITARENGIHDAIIVPNPFSCRSLDDPCKDYSMSHKHNFRIVTYVSIGGGKIESIPTAVTIVNHLNKLLKKNNSEISAVLEIYGKDIPDNIIQTISRLPFVKYMGYVSDFKERIKGADLFLMAYTFPELGFAPLEAVCMGVPLAKLTADPTEEEIIDGFNGVLATSLYEMAVKIYNYLLKKDEQKCYIAKNAISTILRKRDPQVISLYWKYIFGSLLSHER
jgi:glycosyltransferase involved in cell wall biosynthesis